MLLGIGVRTGELRAYGNLLLVKGVVNRYDPR
jgi:L-fucose mutarotase/ribose pyranase (RbsD/FucU family)